MFDEFGHMGHTFGITRSLFNEMKMFDCVPILDDIWNWSKILGKTYSKNV